ncbi:hypothetical protein AB0395_30960 [Streptosporangium sp. NPDC051023]|uniref:hypothetical protein n=1 Tax=Streptosporangium sp. NPDC051023 TaxID=3155410 RepID=UPI00344DFF6F
MSNASRNVRGILTAALTTALATGIAAGLGLPLTAPVPAEAATSCQGRDMVTAPGSTVTVCDRTGAAGIAAALDGPNRLATALDGRDRGAAPLDGPGTLTTAIDGPDKGVTALDGPDRLARTAGLPGLSRASAVTSLADTAGVAAGTGVTAMPLGAPASPRLAWVGVLTDMPDAPGLPLTADLHGLQDATSGFTRIPVSAVPSTPGLTDPADAWPDGTAPVLPRSGLVKTVTDGLPAPVGPGAPAAGGGHKAPSSGVARVIGEKGASGLPGAGTLVQDLGLDRH